MCSIVFTFIYFIFLVLLIPISSSNVIDESDEEGSLEALLIKNLFDLSSIYSRWMFRQIRKQHQVHAQIWQQLLAQYWTELVDHVQASPGQDFITFSVEAEQKLTQIRTYLTVLLQSEESFRTNHQLQVELTFRKLLQNLEHLWTDPFD